MMFPHLTTAASSRRRCLLLGQKILHDVAVHVGEAEIAAGVAEGELLVIEAQQVQDRRVQVMDVHLVLDRARSRTRRCAPWTCPLLMPPPAIHMVKP